MGLGSLEGSFGPLFEQFWSLEQRLERERRLGALFLLRIGTLLLYFYSESYPGDELTVLLGFGVPRGQFRTTFRVVLASRSAFWNAKDTLLLCFYSESYPGDELTGVL